MNGSGAEEPHALAVAARLPDRVSRAACMVGLAPYDVADFGWFADMDRLNVQEARWALQGEEVLVRELEREATEMQERVAVEAAQVIGDNWEWDTTTWGVGPLGRLRVGVGRHR